MTGNVSTYYQLKIIVKASLAGHSLQAYVLIWLVLLTCVLHMRVLFYLCRPYIMLSCEPLFTVTKFFKCKNN